MRAELGVFLAALRFFTRLPVPAWVGHSDDQAVRSLRYLPLVGALVGAVGAAATLAAAQLWPMSLAVPLGMVATVLLTGALHEDGFADACDGFGGGRDAEHVLAIMKDSRLGSYGAIGIGLLLLAKWQALLTVAPARLAAALVASHAASRLVPVLLAGWLDYVRASGGKSQAVATRRPGGAELLPAAVFALAPCLLLPPAAALAGWLGALLAGLLAWRLFRRRIGGYTGDCLGAAQQGSELAFYLGLACACT
jgi:adenosylcobinamide-GDP ribazoletransferase